MARRIAPRRNGAFLGWIRAAVFFAVTIGALNSMDFYPGGVDWLLALLAGVLGIFSPGLGVLAFVVAAAVPLAASDLVVAGVFLVVGFAAVQYLGQSDARAFVVVALAYALSRSGMAWAVIALGGYIMGAGEGAIAALIACLVIEVAGLLMGREAVGVLATGGHATAADPAVLVFPHPVPEPLKFAWFADAIRNVDPGKALGTLGSAGNVPLLVVQPLLWAGGAALAGAMKRRDDHPRRALFGLLAVGGAVLVLGAVSTALAAALGSPAGLGAMVVGAAFSLPVALLCVAVWEWVFPPVPITVPEGRPRTATMGAEDADVDELLRLIESAEEELTTKHTTQAVVMITDMKSFSKMTEEEGSFVTAKLIQKHRDLLLPIVTEHGGRGKSTGGDGLVAAFQTPGQAVAAAVRMQRALADYNSSRTTERDMTIRIGIAAGEVVLDKGGRPFIGAALNLAARVMNLADGGQAMTTRPVADAAGGEFRLFSHGRFELKNIAEPIEVIEILYDEAQEPKPPPMDPVT
ncbi:MAG: adenylate/guanylate cyclase domain-containing protein [Actinobacteria bacterium]|nr:MAG: adenylate/guanylate cyclase domain-containing protein [Actinomycetota bacterium]